MKKLSINITYENPSFSLNAIADISFKGVTAISGVSGAGKTTFLRCLAGLEKKCKGTIICNNDVWLNTDLKINIPTHKRKIGFVFQENLLFPHLSVLNNIQYSIKNKHNNEILSINDIFSYLKIEHLLDKYPNEISGGEKQKVSLARALANSPSILFMDEPLSAIDENSRNEIIDFLKFFKINYSIPILFITHNSKEKLALADSEIKFKEGKIIKIINNNFLQEKNRYTRQTNLKEINNFGQEKILKTKYLCVGAGGLGNQVCLYLTAAGVKNIGIVDDDTIELSNLQRQILYNEQNIGQHKSEITKQKLSELNSFTKIQTHNTKLDHKNAETIGKDYDVLIDCSDNFATNYLLGDLALKLNKPLIYGSVNEFEGQISVFDKNHSPCFRCLFKNYPKRNYQNCSASGVLGPNCGVIGSMQAIQALYLALGRDICEKFNLNILYGQLLKYDFKSFSQYNFHYTKNIECPNCSNREYEIELHDYNSNSDTNFIIPEIEAKKICKLNNCILIDVRDENEFLLNNIENSINIPLSKLINLNYDIKIDKNKEIIIYCQGSRRSHKAAELLFTKGFKKIYTLKGGFNNYINFIEE